MSTTMPVFFISHGGGPCFWITLPEPFGPHAFDRLRAYFAGLLARLPVRPKAFLVISAHWEAAVPTVGSGDHPPMLFDYNGFPEDTYRLNYPAPGSPPLAARVRALLGQAGIPSAADSIRGFDHGVFVPFLIIDPAATIPVVPLSLQSGLDPAAHIAIGAALRPLRDEGILIVGSGYSYHNIHQFMDGRTEVAAAFDSWLNDAVTHMTASERAEKLTRWMDAPGARACHPREEHLLPLMVAAGAAGDDVGRRDFSDVIARKATSGFAFG